MTLELLSEAREAPMETMEGNAAEAASFESLFEAVLPRAYREARYLTGNDFDAEDLLQQTALNAFKADKGGVAHRIIYLPQRFKLPINEQRDRIVGDDIERKQRGYQERVDSRLKRPDDPEQCQLFAVIDHFDLVGLRHFGHLLPRHPPV